jgi:cyclic beta-1,2-glucan synthetase
VTDIVLYEDYPPTYLSYQDRLHRWIRGDWQLLPWMINPARDNKTRKSTFRPIDRWKIFDNLRRSLLAPSLLLLLIVSWFWLPGSTTVWTLFALLTPAVPIATDILSGFLVGLTQGNRINFSQV